MKRAAFWIAVVLVLAGGGFAGWYFFFQGPTLEEVKKKYGPKYEAKREQLKKIAKKTLPAKGAVQGNVKAEKLDPKPTYDLSTKEINTEIAMFEQLEDPDVKLEFPQNFNLLLHEGNLISNMGILGPRSIADPSGRVPKHMLKSYEEALKLPYLVVARTVSYVPPRALANETYDGGYVTLEVFLVDLREGKEKVLGQFKMDAKAPDRTDVTFQKDRSKHASVEVWVYSGLSRDAQRKLAAALTEISGGTFVFDR